MIRLFTLCIDLHLFRVPAKGSTLRLSLASVPFSLFPWSRWSGIFHNTTVKSTPFPHVGPCYSSHFPTQSLLNADRYGGQGCSIVQHLQKREFRKHPQKNNQIIKGAEKRLLKPVKSWKIDWKGYRTPPSACKKKHYYCVLSCVVHFAVVSFFLFWYFYLHFL